jgi:hypothetical protein
VQRARQDAGHFLDRQAPQHEDFRARQQRGVDFKRRVLRRRADEDDVARFDAREKGVLLRLVEAVDFVDEDDRAAARRPRIRSASCITSRISLMPASTAENETNSLWWCPR